MWTTTIDQASILLNMIYFVLAAPYLAYALYTTCESLQNTSRCTVILASLSLSMCNQKHQQKMNLPMLIADCQDR